MRRKDQLELGLEGLTETILGRRPLNRIGDWCFTKHWQGSWKGSRAESIAPLANLILSLKTRESPAS